MEYPIRVLHVVRYLEQGGIQNLLMNLYRNIDREKIQFDFLVCGQGVFEEEIKNLGGKIYQVSYITEVGEKKYIKELEKFFLEHPEYKIVHSHLNQVSGAVMQACKQANVPIRIAHSHNTNNSNNIVLKGYKRYLQSKINKYATDYLACTKEAAKWLFRKNINKAVLLNNAIETQKFQFSEKNRKEIREKLKIDDEAVVIGNVGRCVKAKNQEFLLDIFAEYKKKNKNAFLIIVGEGILKEKLIKKAKKIDSSIKIIEPTKEIEKYYSAFDYFVFPSKFEGLGIVLIEAQISGLQCFASEKVIPASVKITERLTFINLKQSPTLWAEKIPLNNVYAKERNNIAVRGDSYDIKNIAKQLEEIYIERYKKEK